MSNKENKSLKKLSNYEVSSFCRQMALLIKAGISPAEGITILILDSHDKSAKALLESISQVLMSGEKFHVDLELRRCGKCQNNCLLTINTFSTGDEKRTFITGSTVW